MFNTSILSFDFLFILQSEERSCDFVLMELHMGMLPMQGNLLSFGSECHDYYVV